LAFWHTKKAKADCKITRIRSTGNGFHDDLDGCGHQPLANLCRCAVLCSVFVRSRPWPEFAPAIIHIRCLPSYVFQTFQNNRLLRTFCCAERIVKIAEEIRPAPKCFQYDTDVSPQDWVRMQHVVFCSKESRYRHGCPTCKPCPPT